MIRRSNIFSMEGVQVRVIEVIGPIGLVFCGINILMILVIKSLNEPPSDILLFISVLTVLKIAIYFATISIISIIQSTTAFTPSPDPPRRISAVSAWQLAPSIPFASSAR